MATYATELEALNALYDLVETVSTDLATVKTDLATVKADLADVKTDVDAVNTTTAHTDTVVGNISGFVDGTENLLGDIKTNQTAANGKLDAIKTNTDDLKTYSDGVEGKLDGIDTRIGTSNGHLSTIKEQLGTSNLLQTDANALLTELRGATIDVRNVPEDTCIIRVYVGDITAKRTSAAKAVSKLLVQGYRPYMVMGISEDLARVLFVKYPAPNKKEEIATPQG